ncbi:hypothetical protein BC830DRAFT_1142652 [Chytriomyces sp. MP71]|nr:hypothetical protein BC830DRAFT_1142652 [Chytriomyces sp. MP71]
MSSDSDSGSEFAGPCLNRHTARGARNRATRLSHPSSEVSHHIGQNKAKRKIRIAKAPRTFHQTNSGVEGEDRITKTPPELVTRVLSFLEAEDLANIALVSRYVNTVSKQDLLWKELCRVRWMDKKHQSLTLHPCVDYKDIVGQLDKQDKIDILTRRFLQLRGDEDDAELEERILNSTPTGFRGIKVYIPVVCGKWQASYIAAEIDQHRRRITMKELQAYEWIFGEFYGFHEDEDEPIKVHFRPDGLRSNSIQDGTFRRPRPATYQILASGAIQVGEFPTHSRPRRLEDWGWSISNSYVTYTSI